MQQLLILFMIAMNPRKAWEAFGWNSSVSCFCFLLLVTLFAPKHICLKSFSPPQISLSCKITTFFLNLLLFLNTAWKSSEGKQEHRKSFNDNISLKLSGNITGLYTISCVYRECTMWRLKNHKTHVYSNTVIFLKLMTGQQKICY